MTLYVAKMQTEAAQQIYRLGEFLNAWLKSKLGGSVFAGSTAEPYASLIEKGGLTWPGLMEER